LLDSVIAKELTYHYERSMAIPQIAIANEVMQSHRLSLRVKRGNLIKLNVFILTQSPQETIKPRKDSEQQKNNQQPGIGSEPFIKVIPDQ